MFKDYLWVYVFLWQHSIVYRVLLLAHLKHTENKYLIFLYM